MVMDGREREREREIKDERQSNVIWFDSHQTEDVGQLGWGGGFITSMLLTPIVIGRY